MREIGWRTGMACLLSVLAVSTPTSFGVVLHDGVAPAYAPPDAVLGLWGGYASSVAVDPNFVLLSRHQGGGVGTTVTIEGQAYTVMKMFEHDSADLALAMIFGSTGHPARLGEWVPIHHRPTDGNDWGRTTVIGGYGQTAGQTLRTDSGIPYAYQWAGSTGTLTWGANHIDRTLFRISGTNYWSAGLQADFDYPGTGGAVPGEASVATGDSGGGWFLSDGQGGWTLAGLSVAVEYPGEARFRDPVTGAPAAEGMYAVRLSEYSAWIGGIVQANQPLLADADLDGMVGWSDYGILSANWGRSEGARWTDGDFTGDGVVDSRDFSIMSAQWAATSQSAREGDDASHATVGADGGIRLTSLLENQSFYRIYVGFDGGVEVPATGALTLAKGLAQPHAHPTVGEASLKEWIAGTSWFEGSLSGLHDAEGFDTGLVLDLNALIVSGAELWLETGVRGQPSQYTYLIPEPATAWPLGLAALSALRRRSRRTG